MRSTGAPSPAQEVGVRTVIEELVEELEAAGAGADRRVRVENDLGVVTMAPLHLTHVFRNLIANALQHNGERENLVVEVGRDWAAEEPTFFVRDNGQGIESGAHERIFQPFQRASNQRGDGLGLGLALVRAIVERGGGRIWVKSSPGKGATFAFTVPGNLG
jgi:signal transduction histidine kinase